MKKQPRIITIIQARTGSSRLPGKVLLPLGNSIVLLEMIKRVKAAKNSGTVVVAMPANPSDDSLERICLRSGVPIYRGSELDLLDRHYRTMLSFRGDAIVKIPSDCPLIDPQVIDRVIGRFLENPVDYVSNLHPGSYPDGNDVEVISRGALELAWKEASQPHEREHTTPYLWDNPHRFKCENVTWENGSDFSKTHRWVLDYPEDYQLIFNIHSTLSTRNPFFSNSDIIDLLEQNPELKAINKKWLGDAWYNKKDFQFRTETLRTGSQRC